MVEGGAPNFPTAVLSEHGLEKVRLVCRPTGRNAALLDDGDLQRYRVAVRSASGDAKYVRDALNRE